MYICGSWIRRFEVFCVRSGFGWNLCDGLMWPYLGIERSVWDELGVVG